MYKGKELVYIFAFEYSQGQIMSVWYYLLFFLKSGIFEMYKVPCLCDTNTETEDFSSSLLQAKFFSISVIEMFMFPMGARW